MYTRREIIRIATISGSSLLLAGSAKKPAWATGSYSWGYNSPSWSTSVSGYADTDCFYGYSSGYPPGTYNQNFSSYTDSGLTAEISGGVMTRSTGQGAVAQIAALGTLEFDVNIYGPSRTTPYQVTVGVVAQGRSYADVDPIPDPEDADFYVYVEGSTTISVAALEGVGSVQDPTGNTFNGTYNTSSVGYSQVWITNGVGRLTTPFSVSATINSEIFDYRDFDLVCFAGFDLKATVVSISGPDGTDYF